MRAEVLKQKNREEFWFKEGCYILESANDEGDAQLSVARVRVLPGTVTRAHMLRDVEERYIIISGSGSVEIGGLQKTDVEAGDIVRIPGNTRQRITNTGADDLIFYAVCTPPFTPGCYVPLDEKE